VEDVAGRRCWYSSSTASRVSSLARDSAMSPPVEVPARGAPSTRAHRVPTRAASAGAAPPGSPANAPPSKLMIRDIVIADPRIPGARALSGDRDRPPDAKRGARIPAATAGRLGHATAALSFGPGGAATGSLQRALEIAGRPARAAGDQLASAARDAFDSGAQVGYLAVAVLAAVAASGSGGRCVPGPRRTSVASTPPSRWRQYSTLNDGRAASSGGPCSPVGRRIGPGRSWDRVIR